MLLLFLLSFDMISAKSMFLELLASGTMTFGIIRIMCFIKRLRFSRSHLYLNTLLLRHHALFCVRMHTYICRHVDMPIFLVPSSFFNGTCLRKYLCVELFFPFTFFLLSFVSSTPRCNRYRTSSGYWNANDKNQ